MKSYLWSCFLNWDPKKRGFVTFACPNMPSDVCSFPTLHLQYMILVLI